MLDGNNWYTWTTFNLWLWTYHKYVHCVRILSEALAKSWGVAVAETPLADRSLHFFKTHLPSKYGIKKPRFLAFQWNKFCVWAPYFHSNLLWSAILNSQDLKCFCGLSIFQCILCFSSLKSAWNVEERESQVLHFTVQDCFSWHKVNNSCCYSHCVMCHAMHSAITSNS